MMCWTKCFLRLYCLLNQTNKNRNVETGAEARNTDCTQKQIQFVKLHKSHVATVHAATLPTVQFRVSPKAPLVMKQLLPPIFLFHFLS